MQGGLYLEYYSSLFYSIWKACNNKNTLFYISNMGQALALKVVYTLQVFRVRPCDMFLECWKLVKPNKVPRKVLRSLSAIFAALHRYKDKKENIPLFYLDIIGKKLLNSYSLAYNILYGNLIATLFLIPGSVR